MFLNKVRCETGPCGEVAFVNGFEPSGGDRVAAGSMEKGNVLGLCAGVVGAVGEGRRREELPCVGFSGVTVYVEAVVSLAVVLHDFVNHAPVWFVGSLQGQGPEAGDGVPVANENYFVLTFDDDVAGVK